MKAKLLHICKVYLPVRGGVQNVVSWIANLCASHDHTVLTTGADGAIQKQSLNGADVHRMRSYMDIASMPIAPSLLIKGRKLIRESDLVFVHYPFPLADLCLSLMFRLPPLIVYWHSNIVAQKKLKWLTYPFIFLTLLRAQKIIVTSQRMVDNSLMLKRFDHKIVFIPYGLPPVEHDRRASDQPDSYFVLVGRHVSYKGIDVAIRAMQNLSCHLVIAGHGPLLERHKLMVEDLGVAEKISFVKDASDDEIISIIAGSLALIVPSVMPNEAFALVQLEAMRLGKPVINTWLPSSVPSIARDEQEGLTVPPNDPTALAKAMLRLQSDSDLAQQLGQSGLERFQNQFTDQHFKQSLDHLVGSLLGS